MLSFEERHGEGRTTHAPFSMFRRLFVCLYFGKVPVSTFEDYSDETKQRASISSMT